MTPLLSSLREPPVVGRFYMVPAIPFIWNGIDGIWPVLGPLHADARFFGFPDVHYHVDARFVRRDLAKRASIHRQGIEAQTQRSPLARRPVPSPVDVPRHRPELRRFKCQSSRFDYHFGQSPEVQKLRAHYGNPTDPLRLRDGRLLCPHRRVDLSQFPPDENGIVTCPLHGLRVRCAP